ncbi:MAG: sulfotransferase family 2 domain-containing protein [Methyloprofundus sp.]
MTRVVFLHIPKTAGQSVHQFLLDSLGPENMCPARVQEQIKQLSNEQLRSYSVYSGHFDWDFFDFLNAEDVLFFTVLRQPLDRILSFYFFLRHQAKSLSAEQLRAPNHIGMRAALTLSPDEYFADPDLNIRSFIDDHYDNFYTYYFAGRNYQAHSRFRVKQVPKEQVFEQAKSNIKKINAVYTLNNWEKLQHDMPLSTVTISNNKYFTNKGDGLSVSERMEALHKVGTADLAIKKITDFCELDNLIYEQLK